jgi:DNA-binding HxlR family transcriptional regulator
MAVMLKKAPHTQEVCMKQLLAVRDALDVLDGKWKLPIVVSLSFGARRFRQVAKDIPGITDRMLSKELKDLEANHLVTRTVYDTFPPTVEYSMTDHGHTLEQVIVELGKWGALHRKKIMKK